MLAGDYGIGRFESWDHKEFFHFRPLLSGSYARMLSTKNNPIEAVVDMVRETSRIYPALTPIDVFQAPPFDMKPEDLQQILKQISEDPEKRTFDSQPTASMRCSFIRTATSMTTTPTPLPTSRLKRR